MTHVVSAIWWSGQVSGSHIDGEIEHRLKFNWMPMQCLHRVEGFTHHQLTPPIGEMNPAPDWKLVTTTNQLWNLFWGLKILKLRLWGVGEGLSKSLRCITETVLLLKWESIGHRHLLQLSVSWDGPHTHQHGVKHVYVWNLPFRIMPKTAPKGHKQRCPIPKGRM